MRRKISKKVRGAREARQTKERGGAREGPRAENEDTSLLSYNRRSVTIPQRPSSYYRCSVNFSEDVTDLGTPSFLPVLTGVSTFDLPHNHAQFFIQEGEHRMPCRRMNG